MSDFCDDDWYKIIGIRFGGTILFGQNALDRLEEKGYFDQIISKAEFKLLSKFDFGEKWRIAAEAMPVIMMIEKDLSARERNPNPYRHKFR